MQADLRTWLIRAGFPADIELSEMRRGLGSTELWSFSPAPGASPLVVRIFAEGTGAAAADREARAMDAAASHGVPVPTVITQGVIANRSFLVTTFVEGVLAAEAFVANPATASDLGDAMGETLGRINQVVAPVGLRSRPDAWIVRGGPALAPIHSQLATLPDQDRLLHLDFHLNNVLVRDSWITGVIDWENTMAGPPHADLARSRAILRAVTLGGLVPGTETVAQFERGLVAGHTRVAGPDPHPALSTAWGLAMTTADLATQVGKPGSWITDSLVEQLAKERDAQIRAVIAGSGASG